MRMYFLKALQIAFLRFVESMQLVLPGQPQVKRVIGANTISFTDVLLKQMFQKRLYQYHARTRGLQKAKIGSNEG